MLPRHSYCHTFSSHCSTSQNQPHRPKPAPPAKTSPSTQNQPQHPKHTSFPCLWSEALELAGIQAQVTLQRAVHDVFHLIRANFHDFSSTTAKAGGEEISPRYQFDTWPRHKHFMSKILIETAQKGTVVLQNLKHCRIHINFK